MVPMGNVADNVMSLAMVEAAIESNAQRRPVSLAVSLTGALGRAVEQERRDDVALVLRKWQAQGRFARADPSAAIASPATASPGAIASPPPTA